jgi:hypothetical protein
MPSVESQYENIKNAAGTMSLSTKYVDENGKQWTLKDDSKFNLVRWI